MCFFSWPPYWFCVKKYHRKQQQSDATAAKEEAHKTVTFLYM